LPNLSATDSTPFTLFFSSPAKHVFEYFFSGAHFILHGTSIHRIPLLLFRGIPAAPVVIGLLVLFSPIFPTCYFIFSAGCLQSCELPAKLDGRIVQRSVVPIIQKL
jgi:hypothetical protein